MNKTRKLLLTAVMCAVASSTTLQVCPLTGVFSKLREKIIKYREEKKQKKIDEEFTWRMNNPNSFENPDRRFITNCQIATHTLVGKIKSTADGNLSDNVEKFYNYTREGISFFAKEIFQSSPNITLDDKKLTIDWITKVIIFQIETSYNREKNSHKKDSLNRESQLEILKRILQKLKESLSISLSEPQKIKIGPKSINNGDYNE